MKQEKGCSGFVSLVMNVHSIFLLASSKIYYLKQFYKSLFETQLPLFLISLILPNFSLKFLINTFLIKKRQVSYRHVSYRNNVYSIFEKG